MLKPYIDHLQDMPSFECGLDPKKDVSQYDEIVDTMQAVDVGNCDECPGIDMLAVTSITGLESYVENLDAAKHIPDQDEFIEFLFNTIGDDGIDRPDFVEEYIEECKEKGIVITLGSLRMCFVQYYESALEDAETTIDYALRGLQTISLCSGPLTGTVCMANGTNPRTVRVCGAAHFAVPRLEAGPVVVEAIEQN